MAYSRYHTLQLPNESGAISFLVQSCKAKDVPDKSGDTKQEYKRFYRVLLFDKTVLYLAKGCRGASKEIVAFYPNGAFWVSYGLTINEAIRDALCDAWRYMAP